MTDEDRREIADLAMRALDTILDEYGDDASLTAAALVFEVRTTDEDGDEVYHTAYRSLARNSPNHIGGMLYGAAQYITAPETD